MSKKSTGFVPEGGEQREKQENKENKKHIGKDTLEQKQWKKQLTHKKTGKRCVQRTQKRRRNPVSVHFQCLGFWSSSFIKRLRVGTPFVRCGKLCNETEGRARRGRKGLDKGVPSAKVFRQLLTRAGLAREMRTGRSWHRWAEAGWATAF